MKDDFFLFKGLLRSLQYREGGTVRKKENSIQKTRMLRRFVGEIFQKSPEVILYIRIDAEYNKINCDTLFCGAEIGALQK